MALKLWAKPSSLAHALRRFCSDKTPYQREEDQTKKPRIVQGVEYPDWRKPWIERDGEWYSKFRLFQSEKNPSPNSLKFMQDLPYLDSKKIKDWWASLKEMQDIENQKFIPERVEVLGANLAAMHYVTYRGGSVRLRNSDKWLSGDPTKGEINLPNKFKEGYYVEAIDCSNLKGNGLRYEGLENFKNLNFLKWLNLSNNKYIDDWCTDRIAGQHGQYLEYLDVRNCSLTPRSIFAFARMLSLKVLVLDAKPDDLEMQAGLALLEEDQPELIVKCIDKADQ